MPSEAERAKKVKELKLIFPSTEDLVPYLNANICRRNTYFTAPPTNIGLLQLTLHHFDNSSHVFSIEKCYWALCLVIQVMKCQVVHCEGGGFIQGTLKMVINSQQTGQHNWTQKPSTGPISTFFLTDTMHHF